MLVELEKIIPVLIGGLLAIAGGLASQIVIHWLSERRDKRKIRRERIEALMKSVYAQREWISEKRRLMVFDNQDHYEIDPLIEATVIQSLYFPSLSQEFLAIQEAINPLLNLTENQRLKHMKDQNAFIEEYDEKPFSDGYKEYLIAISRLSTKARHILNND